MNSNPIPPSDSSKNLPPSPYDSNETWLFLKIGPATAGMAADQLRKALEEMNRVTGGRFGTTSPLGDLPPYTSEDIAKASEMVRLLTEIMTLMNLDTVNIPGQGDPNFLNDPAAVGKAIWALIGAANGGDLDVKPPTANTVSLQKLMDSLMGTLGGLSLQARSLLSYWVYAAAHEGPPTDQQDFALWCQNQYNNPNLSKISPCLSDIFHIYSGQGALEPEAAQVFSSDASPLTILPDKVQTFFWGETMKQWSDKVMKGSASLSALVTDFIAGWLQPLGQACLNLPKQPGGVPDPAMEEYLRAYGATLGAATTMLIGDDTQASWLYAILDQPFSTGLGFYNPGEIFAMVASSSIEDLVQRQPLDQQKSYKDRLLANFRNIQGLNQTSTHQSSSFVFLLQSFLGNPYQVPADHEVTLFNLFLPTLFHKEGTSTEEVVRSAIAAATTQASTARIPEDDTRPISTKEEKDSKPSHSEGLEPRG